MRVDVKKFLFIGSQEDRLQFFQKAQEAGVINFIETPGKVKSVSMHIQNISNAIKILRGLPTMPQEELEEWSLADGLAHKILQLKHELETLHEDLRMTLLEIARVSIFGDFSKEDIAYIQYEGKRHIQYFFTKKDSEAEHLLPNDIIFVGSEHDLDYFVGISPQPRHIEGLIEMHIDHPVGELLKKRNATESAIHETEQRLKTYAKYNTFLHHALIYKLNSYNLKTAENDVTPLFDESLFTVTGWIPSTKTGMVEQVVSDLHVHMEEIAPNPTDVVPTYLENAGIGKIGEEVIKIYDTPSVIDKDPSIWVLLSFAFFFAFIVNDGGYGFIFLAVALYLKYKYSNLKGTGKRMLNLVFILCASVIAWGFLTNSFFGIEISPTSPLRKVSVLHWLIEKKLNYDIQHHDSVYDYWVSKYPELKGSENPDAFMEKAVTVEHGHTKYTLINKFSDVILLELSLVVGIVHICISLLRYLRRNWSNIGWVMLIIGGYLYLPYYLKATSLLYYVFGLDPATIANEGIILMCLGLGTAVLLGMIQHGWHGLLELMHSIQIFADIMSYLRLYALGLASMVVTMTVNDAAIALGWVFGTLIIIGGHFVNMMLAIMGGTIHGLRLNFLEWYHYSFIGGGKLFKPLRKVQIE